MTRKALWILAIVLALIVGFYPGIYFFTDRKFGLLSSKSNDLLKNVFWNIGFYTHIISGGIALLIGWIQFSSKTRIGKPALHKQIGKIYVIVVISSSIAGICIALFATGGIIASLGFICLGVIWFYTTMMAYINIKNKKIEAHKKMMIFSYAACFAAVTLRIWLPLLIVIFGNFITAYIVVAWLCWIPNLIVANLIAKRLKFRT